MRFKTNSSQFINTSKKQKCMIETKKWAYLKPECNIMPTELEHLLANVSGSAGTISHGEQHVDAKQQILWQEASEDFEEEKP